MIKVCTWSDINLETHFKMMFPISGDLQRQEKVLQASLWGIKTLSYQSCRNENSNDHPDKTNEGCKQRPGQHGDHGGLLHTQGHQGRGGIPQGCQDNIKGRLPSFYNCSNPTSRRLGWRGLQRWRETPGSVRKIFRSKKSPITIAIEGEAEARRDAQIKEAIAEEERMASRWIVNVNRIHAVRCWISLSSGCSTTLR